MAGTGPIGLAVLFNLHRRGVRDIVAVDRFGERRSRALALGAEAAVDSCVTAVAEGLKRFHGNVELCSKSFARTHRYIKSPGAPVMERVLTIAAPGATICVISVQNRVGAVGRLSFMAKELTATAA